MDHGEREAISLASELKADWLLIDERSGERVASILGLKTIGALMDVPRLALARRFRAGEDVVDALDRLTGRKDEPLAAFSGEYVPFE